MAEISCPMCGKSNPAELAVCQHCEARLKPLTDELSRSQPPIHPGDEPKEMDTGQLEPILPQWLREVRQQARDSAEPNAEQTPAEEEAGQPEETADLLAGLQSQSGEEEKIPDWLAGLRGEGGQADFGETSTEDDELAALKSMLGEETPAAAEIEASALPGWVSDLGADEADQADRDELTAYLPDSLAEEPAQPELPAPAPSSEFDWNADFGVESGLPAESKEDVAPTDTDLPAWLRGTDETSTRETESGLPAWMMDSEEPDLTPEGEATPVISEGDLPDWLGSLGAEDAGQAAPPQDTGQPAPKSTTDWLASLGEETAETEEVASQQDAGSVPKSTTGWLASLSEETVDDTMQEEIAQPTAEGDMPSWLSSPGETISEDLPEQEDGEPAAIGDMPDWLSSIGEESVETAPQDTAQPFPEIEKPDWLASLGEESPLEEEIVPGTESTEMPQTVAEDEVPDWLVAMGEATAEAEQPVETVETSALAEDELIDKSAMVSPFVDDEGKPISTEDVDAIFSMDVPDWLSDADTLAQGDAAASSGEVQGDELRPVDLPSWVQAMRPVESVISETEGSSIDAQPVEERGPLAGLRGVLPAVPGAGPTSKPKAYSIRLQASEDQQSNAGMLEKMLAEEISPLPVTPQKIVRTQRLLRWVIAFLLVLVVVGGTVFGGTQIYQMPTSAPLETSATLSYIQNTLPADAPVLLIFDYEAALAGELEASAAPLVDYMLTLKQPRLALIASTPTGTGLSEHFMNNPFIKKSQIDLDYQRGEKFINLGYLPGGAAGVLAFSKDPGSSKPFTTSGENAWATPVLQDVKKLSDFKAILLLTNDVETARIWIEQTESERGDARLLVVTSAQSGPMMLPYVESGQVDGMVTGLDGSAPIEQVYSGRPGMVRRYWDAYSFGLLTAVMLITLGSLLSLISGWQVRRKEQVEE